MSDIHHARGNEKLPDPEIPTIIPETGVGSLNTDKKTTYLKNNNIDKTIRQKLRKKDMYETEMYNINNLIVGKKNEQLQERVASEATL